jgi:tetratricopeptide (TPR) repeat protein
MDTFLDTRRGRLAALGGCLLVAALLYGPTLNHQFLFDDDNLVQKNPAIRSLSNIPAILGLTEGRPVYRALRELSHALDFAISGEKPWAYHLMNLVYHGLCGWFVFRLARRLLGSPMAGAAAALLFLAHPIATEAVAYISGRRDLLTTLFFLWGMHAYVRYRDVGGRWRLVGFFACYVLGMLAKEMAITLPLCCLLFDAWVNLVERREAGTGGLSAVPQAVTGALRRGPWFYGSVFAAAAGLSLYVLLVSRPAIQGSYHGGSFGATVATMMRCFAFYWKQLVFPLHLSGDYSFDAFPVSKSLFEGRVLASMAFHAAVIGGAVLLLARGAAAGLGLLWFYVTLIPVSQIIPHREMMAEHYLYLPLVGLALIAGDLLARVRARAGVAIPAAALAVATVLFTVRVHVRNGDYRSPTAFYEATVETSPRCARAHHNLGIAYLDTNRLPEAEKAFRSALELQPRYALARYNLGCLYRRTGESAKAEAELKEALRLSPNFGEAWTTLGQVLYASDIEAALEKFRKGAELLKGDYRPWGNIATALTQLQRNDEAMEAWKKVTELNSKFPYAWQMLGELHFQKKQYEETEKCFKRVLELDPELDSAYVSLAVNAERAAMNDEKNRIAWRERAIGWYEALLQHRPRHYKAADHRRQIKVLAKQIDNEKKGIVEPPPPKPEDLPPRPPISFPPVPVR